MSRPLLILVIVLLALVGLMVVLSTQAHERPTTQVEKVVPLGNLS